MYKYIYIYIYVCVCVRVCVFGVSYILKKNKVGTVGRTFFLLFLSFFFYTKEHAEHRS